MTYHHVYIRYIIYDPLHTLIIYVYRQADRCYKQRITSQRPALPVAGRGEDFHLGAFGCSEYPCTFAWALLLQQIRMGDTYEVSF